MKIDQLISALERELRKKSKSFLKGDNSIELKILAELKTAIENEFDSARMIEENRTAILKSADAAARKIIEDAQEKSAELLSESEFVQSAKIQADEILRAAMVKQNELMHNFASYLDMKLFECEKGLVAVLDELRRDRERLAN